MAVTISLSGLEEAKHYFSKEKLTKSVATNIGIATLELHGVLRTFINSRYTGKHNLGKQLVRGTSDVKFGKSAIESGLVYKIKYMDLSKFNYTAHWGALNKGMGWVHTVEVVKGQRKVLKGRSGRGGFTPRVGSSKSSHGRVKRLYRGGGQMRERTTSASLPLRTLYGPNTKNMIIYALKHDPRVEDVLDHLSDRIKATYA